jgi:poly(3-hydroxybutyrate) depolymerase
MRSLAALRGIVLAAFLLLGAVGATRADDRPGQLIERVQCTDDPTESYAVYLPANYDVSRKWPVLYCFDPRARGRTPVERFQAGADKFGYIVVGSNNSRNGPWETTAKATTAMLTDTARRYAIDSRRIYLAGLSGGARVATGLGLSGACRGVIACSAGFSQGQIPDKVPFLFFGTAGVDDFNYSELRRVDEDLDELRAPHRVMFFAGGHEWLSADLATQALEWFDVHAMRTGLKPKNEAFLNAVFERRQAALATLSLPERWREAKSLAADFNGLRDTAEIERQVKSLGSRREVREWQKAERALERKQLDLTDTLIDLAERQMGGEKMLKTLAAWKSAAAGAEDSEERRIMRRTLRGLSSMTGDQARAAYAQQNYAVAVKWYELATLLQDNPRSGTWLDLARAHALNGDKKAAVEALRRAIGAGFDDRARLESEPAFAALRGDPAFVAALGEVRAAPEGSASRDEGVTP